MSYKTVPILCGMKELKIEHDFCKYAALKFCDMCFNMPYWKQGSIIDGEYVKRFDSQKKI